MNEECSRSEPAGAGVGRAEKNTLSGWFLILRRRLQRLQLMLPGLQATKFRYGLWTFLEPLGNRFTEDCARNFCRIRALKTISGMPGDPKDANRRQIRSIRVNTETS